MDDDESTGSEASDRSAWRSDPYTWRPSHGPNEQVDRRGKLQPSLVLLATWIMAAEPGCTRLYVRTGRPVTAGQDAEPGGSRARDWTNWPPTNSTGRCWKPRFRVVNFH